MDAGKITENKPKLKNIDKYKIDLPTEPKIYINDFYVIMVNYHYEKYRNFTKSPGVEIFWKGTVST